MPISLQEIPGILQSFRKEVSKVVVGQEDVLEKLLMALLCRGHALLIGVPGMAKTTMVNSFSQALSLRFNRIQFTPDLMPADILGTEILQENRSTGTRELIFHKGPVFTQILLADEINRTPPKTQAALLQSMQEKMVTVFGRTEKLDEPFMVLATQNPIEQEGTYPLPEAQLDRFLFALSLGYPSYEQELAIVKKHTTTLTERIQPVLDQRQIIELQDRVMQMSVSDHVFELAVKLVRATRPVPDNSISEVKKYVKWGAGPRAIQFLVLGAKARALLHGRPTPVEEDIRHIFKSALNHRVLLNFQAEAENLSATDLLDLLLKKF
ncbi:MAG TPA: MoxR family ATPase [Fibrobacteria bacterium]|nr:MoxR family ATPase [Fibrobacteria bacterium]